MYLGVDTFDSNNYVLSATNLGFLIDNKKHRNKKFYDLDKKDCRGTKYAKILHDNFERAIEDKESVINLCGKSKINELPIIMNDLDLLLTNDTGAMHLAIALQVKTLSLFGPTDSKIYGPYQDCNFHKVIQVDGSFVNVVPKKQRGSDGMALISIDQVFEKTCEVLGI